VAFRLLFPQIGSTFHLYKENFDNIINGHLDELQFPSNVVILHPKGPASREDGDETQHDFVGHSFTPTSFSR
jgi:hypothetical protein